MTTRQTLYFTGLLLLCPIYQAEAFQVQDSNATATVNSGSNRVHGSDPNPNIRASRISDDTDITLDGRLDELPWQTATVAAGFTQSEPDDGQPATQQTEARILYTDKELYVGITAFDVSPDSIVATLFRRDGDEYSDWVSIGLDSYNDNRTAFMFFVNPRGVQQDVLFYNDTDQDFLWDAVWEAKTHIHEAGWTAEFRIPLSQLRYSGSDDIQEWGVNFHRWVARKKERSFWAPIPQDDNAHVSKYGILSGITGLDSPKRFEVSPYLSQTLTRAPGQPGNPFYKSSDFVTRIGGDVKYGITPNLTLTGTINPDFGQVEADPATINLSAFETYFQERRPFFLEGNDIFNFGGTRTFNTFGNPATFYSRRIGRAPQGSFNAYNNHLENPIVADGEQVYQDRPLQSTIYGAAKVSGKTRDGWSVGVLNAVTGIEHGDYSVTRNGVEERGNWRVEPATNYFVNRIRKDINEGNSTFGTFLSATNRHDISGSYFDGFLHKSAYLAGVDFEHNFSDKDYTISGTFSYSRVNGSPDAIERTQRAPARYYHRVDSNNLSVAPDRTSLEGLATELSFQKRGGDNTRFSVTYSEVTPGYEVNDLGFENRADYRALALGSIYLENDPNRLRYWEAWTFQMFAWNHDGDIMTNRYNAGTFMEFANFWSFNMNVNSQIFKTYNDRLTRGGPVAEQPGFFNFNMNIRSNQTKKFSFNVGNFHRWEFRTDENEHYYWFGTTYRPTSFISLEFGPEIGFDKDIDQYVSTISDDLATETFGNRYVFADIETVNLSMPFRLNWTFSPVMSLQTYVRPYIATGEYLAYKEFAKPRALDFHTYGVDRGTVTESEESVIIDPDGNGPADSFSLNRPDFSFRSIQTNAVFRWEFRPGSAFFFVWQQSRQGSAREGQFNFGNDFSGIFDMEPTNVFLVKFSYWLGS